MTAYDPTKPVIVYPDVGWTRYDEPADADCDSCSRWERAHHEAITAVPDGPIIGWWTPGWSMTVATEHDMNIARSLAMGLGDKARCDILEEAWSLCRSEK